MNIRPYHENDYEALKLLMIALQEFERTFDDKRAAPDDAFAAWYIKKLFGVLERDRGIALVAEVEGKVAGFTAGFVDEEWEYRDEYFYIAELSVLPEYRGKGIGSSLVRTLEDHARKQGLKRVGIGVISPSTRVHGLYHRLGYKDHVVRLRKSIA